MSKKGGSPECEWMKYCENAKGMEQYDGLLFEIRQNFGKFRKE